jgi:hypothetical protein
LNLEDNTLRENCWKMEITIEDEVIINASVESTDKTEEDLVEIKEPEIIAQKEKIPCLKTLNELKGNVMIDLESGAIQPKKLTGPELLFQKFVKTQPKPKVVKEKVCMMNILSIENGKLGIQRVPVKLDKEVEMDHNRPGFSREKLKQNLRNQIVQKRREIIMSKGLKAEYEPAEKLIDDKIANKENKNRNSDESDEDYDPEAEDCSDEELAGVKQKKKSGGSAFIEEEVSWHSYLVDLIHYYLTIGIRRR